MTKKERLNAVAALAQRCTACKLSRTRTHVVFGEGSPDAKIMFIGEGPGKQEDLTGKPFIGRSGELLTRIIENGMKLLRDQVYITNLVKCRPTVDLAFIKDRAPEKDELEACTPFLEQQIEIIQPRAIITLGSPASKYILKTDIGITKLRGNWGEYKGIPVMPTFHPSYVLRNGGDGSPLKKEVWADIQKVLMFLQTP